MKIHFFLFVVIFALNAYKQNPSTDTDVTKNEPAILGGADSSALLRESKYTMDAQNLGIVSFDRE